ncbi:hypothetical protein BD410DRAFT_625108 [Rickenella mellea]|uniref:Uncharacterized protein n=1 Tax=Rickenella mellea TaxID=50990 RepID=A0A4Y7PLW2_9AGAM|nr:hypothetical protein BD410DRAFT_625108 [Rickenella mellea]
MTSINLDDILLVAENESSRCSWIFMRISCGSVVGPFCPIFPLLHRTSSHNPFWFRSRRLVRDPTSFHPRSPHRLSAAVVLLIAHHVTVVVGWEFSIVMQVRDGNHDKGLVYPFVWLFIAYAFPFSSAG